MVRRHSSLSRYHSPSNALIGFLSVGATQAEGVPPVATSTDALPLLLDNGGPAALLGLFQQQSASRALLPARMSLAMVMPMQNEWFHDTPSRICSFSLSVKIRSDALVPQITGQCVSY
jgi:hypothetical protein